MGLDGHHTVTPSRASRSVSHGPSSRGVVTSPRRALELRSAPRWQGKHSVTLVSYKHGRVLNADRPLSHAGNANRPLSYAGK